MKVLHTSDWHLGRSLYTKKRYEEFEAFLNWLVDTIQQEGVDVLVVAGDVFDTGTPSNYAQKLYYQFLHAAAASCCRHVVVVGGNHDSPTFLNAPQVLLQALDVHVVGCATEDAADEVLVLRDKCDVPELIVCAVPYLRDRDIRTAEAGEGIEDKEQKLLDGIRNHYAAVGAVAEAKREALGPEIPIVGTGHLFTAGGKTLVDDGVRELYVGSLAHVTAGVFPACFDYLALGHLHVPQAVKDSETKRYSGSPLPMGFGEAKQQKSVCLVTFDGTAAAVKLIDVPVFQSLVSVKGDWETIQTRISELAAAHASCWLEIVYEGDEVVSDLRQRLDTAISGTEMEILRVKNMRVMDRVLRQIHTEETLDDLNVDEVFDRCLFAHAVPEDQQAMLRQTYREVIVSLDEEDERAE